MGDAGGGEGRTAAGGGIKAVVLLHDAYGGRGGIAKFNRDLLDGLSSYAEASEVVALPRVAPVDPPGRRSEGVDYRLSASRGLAAYALALLRLSVSPPPDLIVCAHVNLLPFACLLSRRRRARVLLVVHGIDAWQPPSRRPAGACARRVSAAVAVSQVTKRRFLAWSGLRDEDVHVLPNCVDPAAYRPGAPRGELSWRYGLGGRRVIMTLARLPGRERHKGIDEVVEALPSLKKHYPGLAYLVVGDGSDRPRLEAKVAALGLAGDVVFAGHVAEADKADHYRLADAFVLASRGEGFGIVLLEALACGLPCVASTLDGGREALLDGELGELVDPDDPEDLVRGILAALQRPKGEVPEGLRHFSPEAFRRRLHALLDAVLADGRGPTA